MVWTSEQASPLLKKKHESKETATAGSMGGQQL